MVSEILENTQLFLIDTRHSFGCRQITLLSSAMLAFISDECHTRASKKYTITKIVNRGIRTQNDMNRSLTRFSLHR